MCSVFVNGGSLTLVTKLLLFRVSDVQMDGLAAALSSKVSFVKADGGEGNKRPLTTTALILQVLFTHNHSAYSL